MRKALLILLLVLPAIFAADECIAPWHKPTKQEVKRFTPLGETIFAVMISRFDERMPEMIQDLDEFDVDIELKCVDGKGALQWHAFYAVNSTDNDISIFQYPPNTPCETEYRLPRTFANTHFGFGGASPEPPINKQCKGPWRPIQNTVKENDAYEQLADEVVDNKLMPYAERHKPAFYCPAGFSLLKYEESSACFKKQGESVNVRGKTYGKGMHVGRLWGKVVYSCYNEVAEHVVEFESTIPYDITCGWNVTMIPANIMAG